MKEDLELNKRSHSSRMMSLRNQGQESGIRRDYRGERTHILSDVFPVPISKLQGIVLRVSQAPRVAHLFQHSGQGLCLQVKRSLKGPGVGRSWGKTWGRGRVGCFEGKGAIQRWAAGWMLAGQAG